ncbi:MAG: hypothetical protein ACWGHH_02515 [Sulfurovaceae bacterium]
MDKNIVYYDVQQVREKNPSFTKKKIETITIYRTIVKNIKYETGYNYDVLELNLDFFDDLPLDIKIDTLEFFVMYYLCFYIIDNKSPFGNEKMYRKIFTQEYYNEMNKEIKITKEFLEIAPPKMKPQIKEFLSLMEAPLTAKPMTITRIREWLEELNKIHQLKQAKAIKPLTDIISQGL